MYKLNIPGWMPERRLKILEQLAMEVPEGGRILEVGAFLGRSTYCLAASSKPSVRVVAVDTWDGHGIGRVYDHKLYSAEDVKKTLDNFLRYTSDVSDKIEPRIVKHKHRVLDLPEKSFDLIFIDAEHTNQRVRGDLLFYGSKLKPGGMIIGDDYTSPLWPGVPEEVTEFAKFFGVEVQLLDGVWIVRNPQVPFIGKVRDDQIKLIERNEDVRQIIKFKLDEVPISKFPVKKILKFDSREVEDLRRDILALNWEKHKELIAVDAGFTMSFMRLTPFSKFQGQQLTSVPTRNLIERVTHIARPTITRIVKLVSQMSGVELEPYQVILHHIGADSEIVPHADLYLHNVAAVRVHFSIIESENFHGIHFDLEKGGAKIYQYDQDSVYLYNNFNLHGTFYDGGPNKLRSNLIMDLIPTSAVTPTLAYYYNAFLSIFNSNELLNLLPVQVNAKARNQLRQLNHLPEVFVDETLDDLGEISKWTTQYGRQLLKAKS